MIAQLTLLFEKQRYLKNFTQDLIEALQDASNPNSIAVLLQLLDGAPPE